MGNGCADHVTPLYPLKLALTSPTGGGRSVGIVRSRAEATEFSFLCSRLISECTVSHVTSSLGILMYSAWNPKDNYDMSASDFVVQFNGFMQFTS